MAPRSTARLRGHSLLAKHVARAIAIGIAGKGKLPGRRCRSAIAIAVVCGQACDELYVAIRERHRITHLMEGVWVASSKRAVPWSGETAHNSRFGGSSQIRLSKWSGRRCVEWATGRAHPVSRLICSGVILLVEPAHNKIVHCSNWQIREVLFCELVGCTPRGPELHAGRHYETVAAFISGRQRRVVRALK